LPCLFWKWDLKNCLPGLASNPNLPDLPSSRNHRHEPLVLSSSCFFFLQLAVLCISSFIISNTRHINYIMTFREF
jgi:hypothetical protein